MHCPSCGESCKDSAKFCSNCGAALDRLPPSARGGRPLLPFALSVLAFLGLLVVALSMTFFDDAPGYVGSPTEALFHAVGAVEVVIALGILVSGAFLMLRGSDVKMWGTAVLCLGLASLAGLLVIVSEGTFAAIFLGVPGLVALAAGAIARRSSRVRL